MSFSVEQKLPEKLLPRSNGCSDRNGKDVPR